MGTLRPKLENLTGDFYVAFFVSESEMTKSKKTISQQFICEVKKNFMERFVLTA